jgi:proto-oncogene tyrosine-protein kinase Ret
MIPRLFSSTTTTGSVTAVEVDGTNLPVTPKDILSFAWQISKGMAYLSDIKVSKRPS